MIEPMRVRLRRPAIAALAGAAVMVLHIGETAIAQGLVLTPTLTVTETLTDNRDASTSTSREWDLITQVSPGFTARSGRGPLQGSMTYAANGLIYARDSSLNTVYHTLNAVSQLTLFDGRAGVLATATAGRQAVSAFGAQSNQPTSTVDNQTQTVSYSLAPFLTGILLGDVRYRVTTSVDGSRSDANDLGDSRRFSVDAGLSGGKGNAGWTLTGNRQVSEQGDGRRGHTARAVAGVNYRVDVDWQLSARVGHESDDLRTGQSSQSTTTWGWGVTWTPGPRTSMRFDTDRRFFGRSHSLAATHRFARSFVSLSSSRSLNTSGSVGGAEISLYDLLWSLSRKTDPVERDLEVRSQLQGQDPGQRVVVGGLLTSSATVTQRHQLAATYQGLRSSFSLTYFVGRSEALDPSATTSGDLAAGAVRQEGWTASWSHRLTPSDSIQVNLSQQLTDRSAGRAGNDLRSVTATWTARLGPHTDGSLGLRHTNFASDTNPYQESAIIGSLRMQF